MAQIRTDYYKLYEYMRQRIYERVDGVRQRKVQTNEELEDLIDEVMDRLYILHQDELEQMDESLKREIYRGKTSGVV